MEKYLKVKSDVSLVRDTDSNAIVNKNQSEFDKFLKLSKKLGHLSQISLLIPPSLSRCPLAYQQSLELL